MDGEGYYEFFRSLTPRIVTSLMWAYAKVGVRHSRAVGRRVWVLIHRPIFLVSLHQSFFESW